MECTEGVCPQLLTLILGFHTCASPLVAVPSLCFVPQLWVDASIRVLDLANPCCAFHLNNVLKVWVTQKRKFEGGCHCHKGQEGHRGLST